jgi:hypothetical protein
MVEEYNAAFADSEIAEIIASMNRSKLILEQHADQYTGPGEETSNNDENLNNDLIDLMEFIGDKNKQAISRYILLDTLQVASSIYHKKLTDE